MQKAMEVQWVIMYYIDDILEQVDPKKRGCKWGEMGPLYLILYLGNWGSLSNYRFYIPGTQNGAPCFDWSGVFGPFFGGLVRPQ